MKKITAMLLALSLAAALSLTAFAAGPEAAEAPTSVRVWGKVTAWEGEGLLLKNDDEDDPFREVVVHLGDAPVVDAATGLPLEADLLKEGSTLYAWVGPAAAMSLPPQVHALAAVGNVAADAAAPEFFEAASSAAEDPDNKDAVVFETVSGQKVTLPKDVEITPWLTRQIVTLADVVPGAQGMLWKDAEGAVEKVVLFPYAYQAYLNLLAASHGDILGCVNGEFDGETPQFSCRKTDEGVILVPLRAVAEAAGYDVRWDRTLGAVVSRGGETVLSARPNADTIQTPDGEAGLSAPCLLEKGVTYLPAADLAAWLQIFYR